MTRARHEDEKQGEHEGGEAPLVHEVSSVFHTLGASQSKVAVEPRVILDAYDLIVWSIPKIGQFPKSHRFVLGERMERTLYDVLDVLIEARYAGTVDKRELLRRANVLLERFRMQVRLAKDLRFLSLGAYEEAARRTDSVGRQVGGWLRGPRERPV